MCEYFAAHADFHRAEALAYPAFRDRFFIDGYEPVNPYEMVHACEAETIEGIQESGSEAIVATSTVYHSLRLEFRYHLRRRQKGWVISKVEQFCMVCHGKGKWLSGVECDRCKGTGWMVWEA